jgi:hypothetical protein
MWGSYHWRCILQSHFTCASHSSGFSDEKSAKMPPGGMLNTSAKTSRFHVQLTQIHHCAIPQLLAAINLLLQISSCRLRIGASPDELGPRTAMTSCSNDLKWPLSPLPFIPISPTFPPGVKRRKVVHWAPDVVSPKHTPRDLHLYIDDDDDGLLLLSELRKPPNMYLIK